MAEELLPVLRPMNRDDITQALQLSVAEGWNQTENDWKRLVENPENTCLVIESYGKIVGTATAINYSGRIAWIGMVLVEKSSRGKGLSKLLMKEIIQRLETCKSVKLDATPAGKPVYEKFGFKEEYMIDRMTNLSASKLPAESADAAPEVIQLKDIPELLAFDKKIFGAERTALIPSLIRDFPGKAWVLKRNGSIAGYSLGRKGTRYHHIGPVFASSENDARILIANALNTLEAQPVVIDVLTDKKNLIQWLIAAGFVKQRFFVRMFLEKNPYPGITENQYLISGPEFG